MAGGTEEAHALAFGSKPHYFVGTMPYFGDSRNKPEDIHKMLLNNLRAGVRHIDTAEAYEESVPYVRLAIKDSRIAREELFICSKLRGLPCEDYASVRERLKIHMEMLGVEYLDLLLIHWPGAGNMDLEKDPLDLKDPSLWYIFDEGIDQAWENMVRLKEEGLTRRIGVSNFYPQHIARLQKVRNVDDNPPVVNELYLDATEHRYDFVDALLRAGIQVIAYRPLEFLKTLRMAAEMGDTAVPQLEEMRAVCPEIESLEQFVLTWLFARGVNVCVKTAHPEHIRQNLQAQSLAASFPADLLKEFPIRTELSTTILAFDTYANLFAQIVPKRASQKTITASTRRSSE